MKLLGMKAFKFSFIVVLLVLLSCKTNILFPLRYYYSGNHILEFHPDSSYRYRQIVDDGHVYEFSRGTWKQEGNKLFLLNKVSNTKEFPVTVMSCQSEGTGTDLVINVLPRTNLNFAHLPGVTELLDVDLIAGKVKYSIKNEVNIIHLQEPVDKIYFKAYPKKGAELRSEILNDTLRSQNISLKGFERNIVTVDVDCNPFYFAQIKMANDTLQVINDRRIKWKKVYLERPR